MRVEYATDLAFRSPATFGSLYEQLIRQSVLGVKAEQVASFLGRHITRQLAQEIGSGFFTRIEGTRAKRRFGESSTKLHEKCGVVSRIETTTNNVSFSSNTERWNIGTARRPGNSLPSRRPSTA
jgi:hypothetical protein